MKTMKIIFACMLLAMTTVATTSCDDIKDEMRASWNTRHLLGTWVMTCQKFYYYVDGELSEVITHEYSKLASKDDRQLRLEIDRESGDEFYFTSYHASRYQWVFDSEYRVFLDGNRDMYRINTSPTHITEEYIGHISELKAAHMEMYYEEPDYEVITIYEKVYDN